MGTVLELLTDSLEEINVIGVGERVDNPELINRALRTANRLLNVWSLDALFIFHTPEFVFPLTAGKSTYTIGAGGDWNIPRPDEIERARFRIKSSGITYPLATLTDEQYRSVRNPQLTSTIAYAIYFDHAFPLIQATVFYVPSVPAEIILYPWERLAKFESLDQELAYPTGYEALLQTNLAIWLASSHEIAVSPELAAVAKKCRDSIKRKNSRPEVLRMDSRMPGLQRRYGAGWLERLT